VFGLVFEFDGANVHPIFSAANPIIQYYLKFISVGNRINSSWKPMKSGIVEAPLLKVQVENKTSVPADCEWENVSR